MENPFQSVKDEVISQLTRKGERAARDYISSLTDPDLRDSARVHLAMFFASSDLLASDDCPRALEVLAEVENLTERLDGLLELARLLGSHHRLRNATRVLAVVEELSAQSEERADFDFLTAIEYERIGLKSEACTAMSRAITTAVRNKNEQLAANAALWLARWAIHGEPEQVVDALSASPLKDRAQKQLAEIRGFQPRQER
jgi:hypothetical protein